MPKTNGTDTAVETTTDGTEQNGTDGRGRKPSPFNPKLKLTISLHDELVNQPLPSVPQIIENYLTDAGFAVRVSIHDPREQREGAKSAPVTYKSGMVYVAPKGFEWTAATDPTTSISKDLRAQIVAAAKAANMTVEEFVLSKMGVATPTA